jgi:hypothetical protein
MSLFAAFDAIIAKPVLKNELFNTPVIIETLELLRLKNIFYAG